MAIVEVQNVSRYGTVSIDRNKKIIYEFKEKEETGLSGFINAGIYKLHSNIFKNWDGNKFSIESDLFPKIVKKKELNYFIINSDFCDIGVPEDYFNFVASNNNKNKK